MHAGANYLDPGYLISSQKHRLFLHGAYYETPDALKLLSKFDTTRDINDIKTAKLMIYDINACITNGVNFPKLSHEQFSGIKVLIIDSTSASTQEHHRWFSRFLKQKEMEAILFVSSGLKNEQMGKGDNPYGTIRVFTKKKRVQDDLINFIKETEEPIRSNVATQYRRIMKVIGTTPRNKNIVFFKEPLPSSSKRNNTVEGVYSKEKRTSQEIKKLNSKIY